MDLINLVSKINETMKEIDLEPEFQRFSFHDNVLADLRNTPYYRALAAYCKLFSPKKVLEIGTCSGASAVCMAKYAETVYTFDTDLKKVCDQKIFQKNIIGKEINPLDCIQPDFYSPNYDLVFVDIDHMGVVEPLIHKNLSEQYQGISFWDDVEMNQKMKEFWNSIKQNKIIVNWHFTSFGIVEYKQF